MAETTKLECGLVMLLISVLKLFLPQVWAPEGGVGNFDRSAQLVAASVISPCEGEDEGVSAGPCTALPERQF